MTTSTEITLRKLTIDYYEEIVDLWRRAGLPYKPKGRDSKDSIKKQMETEPDLFLGAFHKGKLVGTVIGSYDFRMKGWINRLAVDPAYRRRGVAQKLVAEMEKILKEKGAAIIAALVELPNPASINLFRKMGYRVYDNIVYLTKRESDEI